MILATFLGAGAFTSAFAQAPSSSPVVLPPALSEPAVSALTVSALTVSSSAALLRAQDEYEGSSWHRDQCLGGLTYGAPLKLAVSWAGGLRKELTNGQDVCAFISPKLGLGGARLGAGFARTMGTLGGGVAASAGIIRTFGAPSRADRMSTYAGGSLHVFPVLALGIELGWYKRLGATAGQGRESIVTWSFGLGF